MASEATATLKRKLSRDSSAVVIGDDPQLGSMRRNLATGTWSVHFPPRPVTAAKKPSGYTRGVHARDPQTHARPVRVPNGDPFDLASSAICPEPTTTVFDPEHPELPCIRVIGNKFPAVTEGSTPSHSDGENKWEDRVAAVGTHRVVIQHWRYNTCQALYTQQETVNLWTVLQAQIKELSQHRTSRYIQILENHGPRSGGSLPHPHSQVLALPIIPADVEQRLQIAAAYYTDHGSSVYERIMLDAAADGRVLLENDHVVAMVPAALERSHDIWVVPKRPCSSFAEASRDEIAATAHALRLAMGMLYVAREDPDYNMLLRTAPVCEHDVVRITGRQDVDEWFRWHIEVIPHFKGVWGGIKAYGGFTTVSGTPEDNAQAFLKCLSPDSTIPKLPTPLGRQDGTQIDIPCTADIGLSKRGGGLARINKFFTQAHGRDRLGRVVQFAARAVMGFYVGSTDPADKVILEKATALQNVLMNSRHTHRWMKFLNFVEPLTNAKSVSLLFLSKLCLFIFFVFDAIRWLQKIKLVPGDAGFKTWHPLEGVECEEKASKRWACKKNAFKSALMSLQGFHLSQLYVTNNKYCGIAGVITSVMDVQTQWEATAPAK